MHRLSVKRDSRVVVTSMKNHGVSLEGDENARFCNRIGCKGRIKYTQNTRLGSSKKSSTGESVISNAGKLPPASKSKLSSQSRYGNIKSRTQNGFDSPGSSLKDSGTVRRIVVRSSNPSPGEAFRRSSSSRRMNASSVTSIPSSSSVKSSHGTLSVGTPSSSTTAISGASRSRNTSTRMKFSSLKNERDNSSTRLLRLSDSRSYGIPERNGVSHSNITPHTTSRDLLRYYGINRATEMLLELERIENDEERMREQALLEMSHFLRGLTLYDQHHDMRLDIDNMSYEELLALGERIGTVSTPLTEEELSKSLKRTIYKNTSVAPRTGSKGVLDETKCSICQEEYVTGEMIGILSECHHFYHETCVIHWLRLKNWCPICKASAARSEPSVFT